MKMMYIVQSKEMLHWMKFEIQLDIAYNKHNKNVSKYVYSLTNFKHAHTYTHTKPMRNSKTHIILGYFKICHS